MEIDLPLVQVGQWSVSASDHISNNAPRLSFRVTHPAYPGQVFECFVDPTISTVNDPMDTIQSTLFGRLPLEMQLHILMFVPATQLPRIFLVCREWAELSHSEAVWRYFFRWMFGNTELFPLESSEQLQWRKAAAEALMGDVDDEPETNVWKNRAMEQVAAVKQIQKDKRHESVILLIKWAARAGHAAFLHNYLMYHVPESINRVSALQTADAFGIAASSGKLEVIQYLLDSDLIQKDLPVNTLDKMLGEVLLSACRNKQETLIRSTLQRLSQSATTTDVNGKPFVWPNVQKAFERGIGAVAQSGTDTTLEMLGQGVVTMFGVPESLPSSRLLSHLFVESTKQGREQALRLLIRWVENSANDSWNSNFKTNVLPANQLCNVAIERRALFQEFEKWLIPRDTERKELEVRRLRNGAENWNRLHSECNMLSIPSRGTYPEVVDRLANAWVMRLRLEQESGICDDAEEAARQLKKNL